MEPWMIILIVVGIIIVALISFVISNYNGLVDLRNKVKDQWAQIDVQLKRRFDLIPNLVEVVKGYASHEEETFVAVVNARNRFANVKDGDVNGEIEASNELSQALGRLFALAESYPELKSNTNFLQLQTDLTETEDKIATTRMFYNDTVLKYNNKVEQFPSNLIAAIFGFKTYEFFNVSAEEKVSPKVDFSK